MKREPQPPFPKQKQKSPGLESKLQPSPRFEARSYHAAGKLQGKKALVTGGDSGIGRAVALLYAREGADVAITYLAEEQGDAERTQEEIAKLGRKCVLLEGDLSTREFCEQAIDGTVKELGGLDILVSNAAYQCRKDSLEDISDQEWEHTFRTNIYAYFWLARAALKHMKAGASIIATSSEVGLQGSETLLDYGATKGAINAFTKSLAQQLIKKGIRVNAVAPGPVWTPLNPADQGLSPEGVAKFGSKTPMGRPAQPEEIAPAYVFLACEADSSYITGVILPEMGGEPTSGA